MKEKKWCLYVHTFPNGKRYYGITSQKNPNARWQNGNGYKTCPAMYNAIQEYGWNNIKHEILEQNLDEKIALKKESDFISMYNVRLGNGYNISDSGTRGNTGCYVDYSGEKYGKLTFLKRISEADDSGRYKWKLVCDCGNTTIQYPHNVINGSVLSCGCLKKDNSIKHAKNIIGTKKGSLTCYSLNYTDENNIILQCLCDCGNKCLCTLKQWYGSKKSCGCIKTKTSKSNLEQARSRISSDIIVKRSNKIKESARKKSNFIRPVQCVETQKIYYASYEIADDYGLSVQSNVSKVLRGKIKSCGGYHWRYADEVENNILETVI